MDQHPIPARIVVSAGPAHPLFYPLVPLAHALRGRGHQVVVATSESFAPVVAGAGLDVVPVSGPLDMGEVMARDRQGNQVERPTDPREMVAALGRGFGRLAARTAGGLRDLARDWQADLVVADGYTGATAALASAASGVPWISHSVGPGDAPCRRAAEAEVAPEQQDWGLGELPDPVLRILNYPESLGGSGPEWDGVPVERMRYLPFGETGALPTWARTTAARPRVLVTLGSVQPQLGDLPALRRMVETLGHLDVDLVIAVADHLVAGLGELPPNVVACGWVSLTSSALACDAAVHHGGPGTMMTCLTAGLPQLVVPGPGKPREAIANLAELGAVQVLEPAQVTPELLGAGITELLATASFRERAAAVAEGIRRQPGVGVVAAKVEALTQRTVAAR